jgi:hypothetical protein
VNAPRHGTKPDLIPERQRQSNTGAAPHSEPSPSSLTVSDYRRLDPDERGDPGTVYVDALDVTVRASFDPVPEAIAAWPTDVPQVRFTLDGGRGHPDVQVWMDVPSALRLRQQLELALADPRCRS